MNQPERLSTDVADQVDHPREEQEKEALASTVAPSPDDAAMPPQSSPSDPDYEVPRGTLTETQVLLSLAQSAGKAASPHRPLLFDRHGFLIRKAESSESLGSDDSDGDGGGRIASGAAASTSGRGAAAAQPQRGDARTRGQPSDPPGASKQHQQQEHQAPLRPSEAKRLERQAVGRLRKWRKMLGPGGSGLQAYAARRPVKLKRRVRKGIPEQLRGLAWLALSGGRKLMLQHPGLFTSLAADDPEDAAVVGAASAADAAGEASDAQHSAAVSPQPGSSSPPTAAAPPTPPAANGNSSHPGAAQAAGPGPGPGPGSAPPPAALDPAVQLSIMRDLNRTFPTHIFYMERQGPGQRALYTVLRAYARYDSGVGYVQGMGFIAAVLLLYMAPEEAFWTLVAIMQGPLGGSGGEGLRSLYLPGMVGLHRCCYQFKGLLHDAAPRLAARMEREGVEPLFFATHWFNTAFAYSLPFSHLLPVWDVFLAEGFKTVFRVGLAVLQLAEVRLASLPFEALLEALSAKRLPQLLPADPRVLLRRALRTRVTGRLAELRAEWEAGPGKQWGGAGAAARKGAGAKGGGR